MDADDDDKKCRKIHGYISSSDGDSDEDGSKCELDKRYVKYKPPPLKIDPVKHKVVMIDQSDEENHFGDQNIVNCNFLHSETSNESSSRSFNKGNVNDYETVTLPSDVEQGFTKTLSKSRRRKLKKHGIILGPTLIKSEEVESVHDDVKSNPMSNNEERKSEEKYRLQIGINHGIRKITLEDTSYDQNSESQKPFTNRGNSLSLENVADTRTEEENVGEAFQFNARTCNVISSTLLDDFVQESKSRNKRKKRGGKKKKKQTSKVNCELELDDDFSREDINTINQKFEDATTSAIAESLFNIDPTKYVIKIGPSGDENKFGDETLVNCIDDNFLHSETLNVSSSIIVNNSNVHANDILTLPSDWTTTLSRKRRRTLKKRSTTLGELFEVVKDSIKLNLVSDNEECDFKTISGDGSIKNHQFGQICTNNEITEDILEEICCGHNSQSREPFTNSGDSLCLENAADVKSTNLNVSVKQNTKTERENNGEGIFQFNNRISSVASLTLSDYFVKKSKSQNKGKKKKNKQTSKEDCELDLGNDFSGEDINTNTQKFEDVAPYALAESPLHCHDKYNSELLIGHNHFKMAKRLTEEMVIARTKISDLSKIKRLNCWGSELVDVSLLRKMPSVEVLSLSINKINSLVDFQFCKRLEELYIRQNDIRDINEVVYLQNLPNLKNLWLGENPCANVEEYRLAVIKALPQLQKLDNVQVTQEDLREAQRKGRTLTHPDDAPESEEEEYVPQQQQQYNRYQEYSESEYSPVQRSPPRQEPDFEIEESEDLYPREEVSEESKGYSPPIQQSPPRRAEPVRKSYSPEPAYVERRRNSYERESPKQQAQYYDRCPAADHTYEDNTHHCDNNYREVKIVNSQSANCIKEYTNGDRYVQSQSQYRQNEVSDVSSAHSHERRERYTCPATHIRPPFARRPVTRNSNILSAVLRLVKELDYPSLEVVEMEVRSRMDELDE